MSFMTAQNSRAAEVFVQVALRALDHHSFAFGAGLDFRSLKRLVPSRSKRVIR